MIAPIGLLPSKDGLVRGLGVLHYAVFDPSPTCDEILELIRLGRIIFHDTRPVMHYTVGDCAFSLQKVYSRETDEHGGTTFLQLQLVRNRDAHAVMLFPATTPLGVIAGLFRDSEYCDNFDQ